MTKDQIIEEIKQIWAETLNISPESIQPETHYFDDLDGLNYMQVVYDKFPNDFKDVILMAQLFAYPTLEKLTDYLVRKLNP